jgi:hypothetical protein
MDMSKQLNVRAIPDELYSRFKELCRREGEDMSEKIRTWIDQYVRQHWPGNPQLPLTEFTQKPPSRLVCLEGERGLCPQRPTVCVLRRRYVCRFDS